MSKLTKEQRHAIYELAYKIYLERIKISKKNNCGIYGMCYSINKAKNKLGLRSYDISDLPEFIALKPKNKTCDEFWWSINNTNITRNKKYKQIIKETE